MAHFLTGYVWDEKSEETILLQRISTGKESFLLAGVGSGKESGELLEGLQEWLWWEGVHLAKGDTEGTRTERELKRVLRQYEEEDLNYALFLARGNTFWMTGRGNTGVYLLNNSFNRPHMKPLLENGRPETNLLQPHEEEDFEHPRLFGRILYGTMEKGVGILLTTEGFWGKYTSAEEKERKREAVRQCLNPGDISGNLQIEKRLRELQRAVLKSKQEENDKSAVYLKTI